MYDPQMLTRDVNRAPAMSRFAGCAALAGAAASVACHAWLWRGVFVPIRLSTSVEYVFISSTGAALAWIASSTVVALVALHLLVHRVAARAGARRPLLSWSDVSYVRPLWCFAATALALLNLVRPRLPWLSVLSYAIVDLRWWWTALVVLWLARTMDVRLGQPWSRRLAPFREMAARSRRLPEVTIAVIAVGWSWFGTPILRDDGATAGDEPKYVRYCENWYQGRGFDISGIKPIAELPADFSSHLWSNVVLVAQVTPGELRGMASDALAFLRHPSRDFNRARHRDGGFLDGKAGGMYQVHNPGVSLLMLPAYYVDRTITPVQPGSPAQWPAHLHTVNAFFLGVYAAWAILMYRVMRRSGAGAGVAWLVALASTLTLPAAAFPFQYYPELAAGLCIAAVGAHILFGSEARPWRSLGFGLITGYLLWLHVRFAGEAVALAGVAIVLWRGQWRRVSMFLAGMAIPMALFSLYAYRISGSAIPGALWMAEGSEANFNLIGMVKNSVGYLFDREWGLFAHSPVLLLALPGYWRLARERPRVLLVCAVIFLALLLPSAGKTLVQTTPMRLITAAIPFGALPMIAVLRGANRRVWLIFALLAIVSLDNALAYNLHHYRHGDTLVDWSFSGWKVNLLFPQESRRPWTISPANGALLVAWMLIGAALVAWPILAERRRERPRATAGEPGPRSPVVHAFAIAALFVALGTATSAVTHDWTGARFLPPPEEAAQQAALMVDELGECTICIASPYGRVSARRITAALETVDPAVANRQRRGEQRAYDEWLAMPGRIRGWYLEANGHEPGPSDIGHHLYQWREEHVAPAEIRRRIFAAAGKSATDPHP
jgi:hypothetical protein